MRWSFFPLLLLALLVLPGCSNTPATTQPGLIAAPGAPIADVPAPAGFSMRSESRSFITPGTGQRWVDHVYRCTDPWLSVVRFYRDQMPAHGWGLASQQQFDDTVTLNFTKNAEEAIIKITDGTFHTYMNIQIHPIGRPATK